MTNQEDDLEIEYKPLDIDLIKSNVPNYTTNKLCEIIVCDRYFGCYKDVAIICMEELVKRRLDGDSFGYEDYIEKSLKELPVLNLNGFNLRDVLQQNIGKI
jgi:hypothetical protein